MNAEIDVSDVSQTLGHQEVLRAFPSINLGYHTKLIALSLADFVRLSVVANREHLESIGDDPDEAAQRSLNEKHATELAKYMLKGLMHAAQAYRARTNNSPSPAIASFLERMGTQSYFGLAPVVATVPDVTPGPNALPFRQVLDPSGNSFGQLAYLPADKSLHVIDGQHRRFGANLVVRFLEDVTQNYRYPKKGSLFPNDKSEFPSRSQIDGWLECLNMARRQALICVEVHLGLSIEQQRQLFYDLNSKGLKVSPNLAVKFDDANPAVRLTKSLESRVGIVLTEKVPPTWDEDVGSILQKDAVAVTALALANAKSEKGVQPKHGDQEHLDWAMKMWEGIAKIPDFGTPQARYKTVAAQPVVLKGIARAIYECAWLDADPNAANQLINAIPAIDFKHTNPMWRLYVDRSAFEQDASLASYVPDQPPSNGFSEVDAHGYVRFRPNHADIYPIIASLVRKAAGLDTRRKK